MRLWIAGLVVVIACGAVDETGSLELPEAPPFTLATLDGGETSLADYAGRTVVIDFWATWCVPCVHQIPVLNEFHRAQGEGGAVVLGVSVDAEGRDVVAEFAAEHEIAYTVVLGNEALARRYGAPGFPAMAIVDPSGGLASIHVGLIEPEELRAAVAQAEDRTAR